MNQTHLGIVGLGEAGTRIATGLKGNGQEVVFGYDKLLAEGTFDRPDTYEELGITLVDRVDKLVDSSDIIFSFVTPSASVQVARDVAQCIKRGMMYVDFNSCLPQDKQISASVIETAGGDYIDAAVLGSVRTLGHAVPVWAAGNAAVEFHRLFSCLGMKIRVVEEPAGAAASIKLLRSLFTKGLEALCVEAFSVAHRLNATELLFDALEDFDQKPIAETLKMLLMTHPIHAGRRCVEAGEALSLVKGVGINPIMTEATVNFFCESVRKDFDDQVRIKNPQSVQDFLELMNQSDLEVDDTESA